MSPRVAVIGAGISGLAAARELLRAGYEVLVIEASDRPGGVLGSDRSDGFLMERAASSVVSAEHGAAELAQELGVPLEEVSGDAQKRWVYEGGALREIPSSYRKLMTSGFLSWRAKLRLLSEPIQPNHPGADESIDSFSKRRLGDEVARNLVAPFVTGVFAGDSTTLSMRACFPSIAALEARGGIVRGLAATRVETAIAKIQGSEIFGKGRQILAPVGGMGALVKALATELEPCIRYSTSIASIEKLSEGFVLYDAQGTSHRVDGVVLATPAYVSASLVRPHVPEMAQALREIPYVPVAVVGLGYTSKVEAMMKGFGVLTVKEEPLRVLGAVFESSCWSARAPEGGVMIRCILGGTRTPEILELSNREIVAAAQEDIQTILGIGETPSYTKVVRWPRAIPQYTVGHLDRVQRIEKGAQALGIVVTGSAIDGISVNQCIAKGRDIAMAMKEKLPVNPLVALLFFLSLFSSLPGCGSSKKESGDSGTITLAPKAPPDAAIASPELSLEEGIGKVEIRARWLWPDSGLRRSPGRNQCGVARRPALQVELMGGLLDTAVLANAGTPPGAARLFVEECRISPRVSVAGVGKRVTIESRDLRSHTLIVESWNAATGKSLQVVGNAPMRVIGQAFSFVAKEAGSYRIYDTGDPEDFAYVVVSKAAAGVSDMRGIANLELPAGPQHIELWHPPNYGAWQGARASIEVEVLPKVRTKHVVDLVAPSDSE